MRIKFLIAGSALALGGLAEAMLWNHRAGPGWLVFTVTSLLLALELRRRLERSMGAWVWILWGSALAFSLALVTYDAEVVHQAGPWLAGLTVSLAAYWTLAGPAPMDAFGYPGWLLRWADFPSMARESGATVRDCGGQRPAWGKILQGMVLAAPLMLVFGCLFLAADPHFGQQLDRLGSHFGPFSRALMFALVLAGCWHHYARRAGAPEPPGTPWQADPIVLGVALVCLNLLFASFLLSQAGYLFRATLHPDFSVAEYARRGFFELVTATLLVLALVLVTYALLHRRARAGGALGLLALLILQTFGLAGSAVHRMGLYIDSFGLTLLRTYVEMALLGICMTLLLVLIALIQRPTLPWLTARMLLLGLVMLAGAGLVDVERMIAEVNTSRAQTVDMDYLGTLSADALPALEGPPADRIRSRLRPLDWRTLNLSRLRQELE